jgi:chromate reductase, NAD(P)H dehydrogenase (quinone)
MATPNSVVVIVGSLRKESFSLKIANALAKLAPDTLKLNVTTLHDISFFNQDLEANPPADWLAFRDKLQKSNGVLFITPEYNRSIPGVLKNAIDVGSRPYGKSSFLGKPIGIISNSPGPLGGVSAAKHLQNVLPGISGPIMGQPEIYLNAVGDAFDDKGQCTKESLQKVLQQYVDAFAAFVDKQNK